MKIIKFLITFISILFLFLPKINLINIGSSGGIRLDDIFLLCVFFILVINILVEPKHFNLILSDKLFRIIFYITFISGISFLVNLSNMKAVNILYSLRILEYSIFIYLGYYIYKFNFNLYKIVFYYGLTSILVIYLQYYGLLGGFVLGEYVSDVSKRPIGLTAGPWEVGMILNFFTIFSFKYIRGSIKYIYMFLAFSAILITGSRIAVVAMIAMFILMYWRLIFRNVVYVFFGILFILILSISFSDSNVVSRSQALLTYKNIEIVTDFYSQIVVGNDENLNSFTKTVNLSDTERDVSWMIRVKKWIYLFKKTSESYTHIIFGNGCGFFGNAVDGSYFRIFGEIGILGLFYYLFLLKTIGINKLLRYITIAVAINMIFIDVIYSYKTMSFVFLIYGYYFYSYKNNKIDNSYSMSLKKIDE